MSCWSEVGLAVTGRTMNHLFDLIQNNDRVAELLLEDGARVCGVLVPEPACLFYWHSVKWLWVETSGVAAVMSILRNAESDNLAHEYRFVRVGDDFENIEHYGRFTDNPFQLGVSVHVSFEPYPTMAATEGKTEDALLIQSDIEHTMTEIRQKCTEFQSFAQQEEGGQRE